MNKAKEERYRIKINLTTGELEAEGSKQFVEKILNEYGDKLKSMPRTIPPKTMPVFQPVGKEKQISKEFPKKTNIKDFYLEKKPRNDKEMAAVVAFYLSEVAESPQRQPQINVGILRNYIKKAGYKLPTDLGQTLRNAKFTGYLESGDSRGEFKLSAIGYNLVAHELPGAQTQLAESQVKRSLRVKKGKIKKRKR